MEKKGIINYEQSTNSKAEKPRDIISPAGEGISANKEICPKSCPNGNKYARCLDEDTEE